VVGMESCTIEITSSAQKHGNLNLSRCGKEFFPRDTIGCSSRKNGVGIPIEIKAEGLLQPIKTDIPTDNKTGKPRWLFRERAWVKEFVKINSLTAGDKIKILRMDKNLYKIVLLKETLFGNVWDEPINSPFRYAGGKFYARKLILEHVPQHSIYIEPFCGGSSIFFAKPKAKNNWLNDIDKDLTNCLLIIRDKPNELIEQLKGEIATKERHAYYKNKFKPKNKLDKAVRWFYLNRTSYSGIMNMQNCYWGYGEKYSMGPENWPRNILRTSAKLQGVKLTSLDFEEVIKQAPAESFLFIDPPYFNADQDKFYACSFKKDDHYRLESILKKHNKKIKFLLTYDNSQEIKKLYYWAEEMHEREWNYTINRTDDQKNGTDKKGARYKGKEVFIVNYNSLKQMPLFDVMKTFKQNA
jgi:DNA adenine methylase